MDYDDGKKHKFMNDNKTKATFRRIQFRGTFSRKKYTFSRMQILRIIMQGAAAQQ